MGNTNEEMDDLSLADALEVAFNEYDKTEEVGGSEENAEKSLRTEEAAEEPKEPTAEPVDAEPVEVEAKEDDGLKPPQSWRPAAREEWKNIPANIREEVLRRETQINTALQESAETRKLGEELQRAAMPFMDMIRSENSNPVQAAESMFRTAAVLKAGSQIQKATMLADIINQYGIDVGMLDQVLSHGINTPQQMPQAAQMPNPAEFRDPRLDKLFEQHAQLTQQAAEQNVQTFAKDKEFFADVREDMADIMEVASRRGVDITLEDAYNRAIAMNPDISRIIQQRQQAQNAGASTARSRRAASSIKSTPSVGQEAAPDTLRGALEQAIQATG